MRTLLIAILVVLTAGAGLFWWLSAPDTLAADDLPTHTGEAENGRVLFFAGGCASCHAAEGAKGEAKLVLSGGRELATPFGPIAVPNISPDPAHGIGGWSTLDFANAMVKGVSPAGHHYVPAFPFTSYRAMRLEDVMDLKAFMDTLPASDNQVADAGLPFPWSWRRPIGLWKRFLLPDLPEAPAGADEEVARGHYLTVAVGHCGECHTPRTGAFAMDPARWLAGAPAVGGEGFVPNITPSRDGIGSWTASDIAYLLESGFTPEFDSVGGEMGLVVEAWAEVPAEDRDAVAAYLKAIPPLPTARPGGD